MYDRYSWLLSVASTLRRTLRGHCGSGEEEEEEDAATGESHCFSFTARAWSLASGSVSLAGGGACVPTPVVPPPVPARGAPRVAGSQATGRFTCP
jgi:hypothetical protein